MAEKTYFSHTIREMRDGKNTVSPGVPILRKITSEYQDLFVSKGYDLEPSVPITAKLDPTVRFIGAPISVLKPYFLNDSIHPTGNVMVQNCIRTRNLKLLFDLTTVPKYGSFFTGLCTLVKYNRLSDLSADAMEYFYGSLGLQEGEVCINVSAIDRDLLGVSQKILPIQLINIDTKPPQYYRHRYGVEGVFGRNFNFAILNNLTNEFDDVGNIIIIERGDEKIGVELALGDTTIAQQLLGLEHVQDNYALGVTFDNEAVGRRVEDAMLVALSLYSEGLKPRNASLTQSRILRSYMKCLSVGRRQLKMDYNTLIKHLERLSESHKLPFNVRPYAAYEIVDWIREYDDSIDGLRTTVNKEDLLIKSILEST